MDIKASKRDVIWNYVGTFLSMFSSFLLLPFLLYFLNEDEIGLWYVFVAISTFVGLFEFGFNPTFARNITYCLSGVTTLTREGKPRENARNTVDHGLLGRLLASCKVVYAGLSAVAFVLLATIGTGYVLYVARKLPLESYLASWIVVVVSIVLNLYYLYALTFLRGFGDIEGENKTKVISRVAQLLISGILLACGLGLLAVAIGLLFNGLIMRLYALTRLRRKHGDLLDRTPHRRRAIRRSDLVSTLGTIWHIAWRDGVVQLSSFASYQVTSIICSLFLGLSQTGIYSISSQCAGAVTSVGTAYIRSFYPTFQSSFAKSDLPGMRHVVERGLAAYYILTPLGGLGVAFCVLPLIPILRPGYQIDIAFFLAMTVFNFFASQYSVFCNLIVSINRIPYMASYVISAIVTIALSFFMLGVLHWGIWGLLLAQFLAQASYNFWRWPQYIMVELRTGLLLSVRRGCAWWMNLAAQRVGKDH